MTKRELRRALPTIPLGDNPNRLAIALTLTRTRLAQVREATGLHVPLISGISTGRTQPTPAEQAVLAQYFGVPVRDLFPSTTERAA